MVKAIKEFNKDIGPDVKNMVKQVGELELFREDLRTISAFLEELKENISQDTQDMRTKISKLNANVAGYYKKNMQGFEHYVNKIDEHTEINHKEIAKLNDKIEGLLATNIVFNQMYEKLLADGETYKQVVAGIVKGWSEENLAKSAYKRSDEKSLMSRLLGKG